MDSKSNQRNDLAMDMYLGSNDRFRRPLQLIAGLWLFGATMALMVKAGLGLGPWDVLHQGLARQLPLSFGAATVLVGGLVLLAWIPLGQRPGIGTMLNIVVVALSVDLTLQLLPTPGPRDIELRCGMLIAGVIGNGLATAMYVGANLGAGPRDGLWLGIVRRTNFSIRQVRTALELTVLVIGVSLGGMVNFGTVLFALAIGPIVQFWLPLLQMTAPAAALEARPKGQTARSASA
jgi:uncharacterized membrane protein YczE